MTVTTSTVEVTTDGTGFGSFVIRAPLSRICGWPKVDSGIKARVVLERIDDRRTRVEVRGAPRNWPLLVTYRIAPKSEEEPHAA